MPVLSSDCELYQGAGPCDPERCTAFPMASFRGSWSWPPESSYERGQSVWGRCSQNSVWSFLRLKGRQVAEPGSPAALSAAHPLSSPSLYPPPSRPGLVLALWELFLPTSSHPSACPGFLWYRGAIEKTAQLSREKGKSLFVTLMLPRLWGNIIIDLKLQHLSFPECASLGGT